MGRKKIVIEYLEDHKIRRVCFKKRRMGILKKAIQLSILTGCKFEIKIYNPEDKSLLEHYSEKTSDFESVGIKPESDMVKEYAKILNHNYNLISSLETRLMTKQQYHEVSAEVEGYNMQSLFSLTTQPKYSVPLPQKTGEVLPLMKRVISVDSSDEEPSLKKQKIDQSKDEPSLKKQKIDESKDESKDECKDDSKDMFSMNSLAQTNFERIEIIIKQQVALQMLKQASQPKSELQGNQQQQKLPSIQQYCKPSKVAQMQPTIVYNQPQIAYYFAPDLTHQMVFEPLQLPPYLQQLSQNYINRKDK